MRGTDVIADHIEALEIDEIVNRATVRLRNMKSSSVASSSRYGLNDYAFARLDLTVCEVCHHRPRSRAGICIDHDHETMMFRGVLCRSCNTLLGYYHDDPDALRASAANYSTDRIKSAILNNLALYLEG